MGEMGKYETSYSKTQEDGEKGQGKNFLITLFSIIIEIMEEEDQE